MYILFLNIIEENKTTATRGVKFGACGINLENNTKANRINEMII